MTAHVHCWLHVSSTDWLGRPAVVCRCTCGRTLSESQILTLQEVAA